MSSRRFVNFFRLCLHFFVVLDLFNDVSGLEGDVYPGDGGGESAR